MNRFFMNEQRINSVLFLLILLSAGAGLLWAATDGMRARQPAAAQAIDTANPTEKRVEVSFGQPQDIVGTTLQSIDLETVGEIGKYSSGHRGGTTRNILLLDGQDKPAKWLFASHKQQIYNHEQLSLTDRQSTQAPTLALLINYAPLVLDDEQSSSRQPLSTVAVSRVDGGELTDVLQGVEQVFSKQMLNENLLSIVYLKGKAVHRAQISLRPIKLVSNRELVALPQTL